MLGLTLRKEFQGKRLRGTAIELANENRTGATQVPAAEFLEITYPSADMLKAIEAIGPDQGRSLVLIGERGQGKSHVMAALYHALTDAAATQTWLRLWANRLDVPKIADLPLRSGMKVISESLQRQRYKFLWDILFEQHPHGNFVRGKWEGQGDRKTEVPSDALILELLRKQPTALLLDEFQTWFDGLTNTKQFPWRNWAFNFVQILSEIAKEHPDLLVLVVSVRSGATDAYQQIHRVNPVQVDFKGPNAERDRRRLLLHRLFDNRANVPTASIEEATAPHVAEYLRLANVPESEHERRRQEFVETWPFAPPMMQLLEDQVLVATEAQETRDLIRILADVFKGRGDTSPVLTAADFRLDDEATGIGALLSSVANQHHAALREKALRNLTAVREAVPSADTTVPHLAEIVSALWLRSIAVGNLAGAEPAMLQIDVTREAPIDDNAFQVEIAAVTENSFNIHKIGERLVFREEENPHARLMAHARNDRLFTDGSDHRRLAREVRYVLGGAEEVPRDFRVIVLPQAWLTDPWSGVEEGERPDQWDDRLLIVVVPEEPDKLGARLGGWLKEHLQKRRNTIRFLVPRNGALSLYLDRDLVVLSRAVLKSEEWKAQSPEYGRLLNRFQGELRGLIKDRFDRFAVLKTWNFADPARCLFHVEGLTARGSQVPDAIDRCLREDLFVPEDFEALMLVAASQNDSVGKLLREVQEPRPNEEDCIPWLGETAIKEKVVRLCAKGKIAISLRGTEYLQTSSGEDEENAWRRMRAKLGTGKHLDETILFLPQAVPTTAGGGVGSGVILTPPPALTPASAVVGGVVVPSSPAAGGGLLVPAAGPAQSPLSAPATSAVNLMGQVEKWGINPATPVRDVTLRVTAATGAQLQKLLRSLPDGLLYDLSLKKDDA